MNIKTEILEIASNFMESAEMVECLKSANYLSIYGIIEIIMGSRSSLTDKVSALRLVSAKLKEVERLKSENFLNIYRMFEIITSSHSPIKDKVSAWRFISSKRKQIEVELGNWTQEAIQRGINDCEMIIKIGEYMLNEIAENAPAGTVFILSE